MKTKSQPLYLILIVLLGLTVRLIAWSNTYVVNPDGTLYIFQAKAFYFGHKEALFCGYSFLANYPVFIAGLYGIFQDWIFSARLVSFLFGTAALIPLYLLLRRFFDAQIGFLSTLIFAMLPVFVGFSVDMVREPIGWFFLFLALFFFIKALENGPSYLMLLSSLSFLMASWARAEVLLFFGISFLYLLLIQQEGRVKKFSYFAGPILLFLAFFGFYSYLIPKSSFKAHLRFTEFVDRLLFFHGQYQSLIQSLKTEAFRHKGEVMGFFLSAAKTHAWLVALGTLLNRFLESLLYIFALVFALGLPGIGRKIKESLPIRYLMILSALSLLLLYVQVLSTWWIEYRHMYFLILPSFIIIGFGLERIQKFLEMKFTGRRILAFLLSALLIISLTLPKNLLPRDKDKVVFKEIGESIAALRMGTEAALISTPQNIHHWISFYANIAYPHGFCPIPVKVNCWEFNSENLDQFLRHLIENQIRFLVWTEKQWPAERIDFSQVQHYLRLKELGRWRHPMTGEIIVLEIL
ncbi:MAG: glycosyltransferase family 39 protein [Thermodesulfobacteriota bacterium]